MTTYAPEALVITTSAPDPLGGDDVTIERSTQPDSVAYLRIFELWDGGSRLASAFLTLADAIAVRDQFDAIIADATR